ncbi:MAG: type II toxin-antitoxin system CcdA family antitoxin [Cellvibrio sp.]|nr:type II toxin-antitoxin system CcdA family antitoxin [Cellvibrio sp.]
MNETNVEQENLKPDLKIQITQDWLAENRKAIEDYNRSVKLDGVFSDGLRSF